MTGGWVRMLGGTRVWKGAGMPYIMLGGECSPPPIHTAAQCSNARICAVSVWVCVFIAQRGRVSVTGTGERTLSPPFKQTLNDNISIRGG